MVFRSEVRWFEPSLCRRVVSLDKKLYSALSLFTQVYKWVPAIIMLGRVTLLWTSFPSRGDIPSHFMLQKPELSASPMGLLARMQTLPLLSQLPKLYLFLNFRAAYIG